MRSLARLMVALGLSLNMLLWLPTATAADAAAADSGSKPIPLIRNFLDIGDGYTAQISRDSTGYAVSYALSILDSKGKNVVIKYLDKTDKDAITVLYPLDIHVVGDLVVLTGETGTAFLVAMLAFNRSGDELVELAVDGSNYLPEFISLNRLGEPSVGLIRTEGTPIGPNGPIPSGERFYFMASSRLTYRDYRWAKRQEFFAPEPPSH